MFSQVILGWKWFATNMTIKLLPWLFTLYMQILVGSSLRGIEDRRGGMSLLSFKFPDGGVVTIDVASHGYLYPWHANLF